jgi:hypothetical protein
MSRPWSTIGLVGLALSLFSALAAPAAAAETIVNFPSLDGATDLIGHLTRPEGDAARPAVVLMHGCSGLNDKKGRVFGLYRAWARALGVPGCAQGCLFAGAGLSQATSGFDLGMIRKSVKRFSEKDHAPKRRVHV